MTGKSLEFGGRADAYLEWAQHTGCRYLAPSKEVGLIAQEADPSRRIVSHTVPLDALSQESPPLKEFARLELASPIASERDLPHDPTMSWGSSGENLILGVIDDGFPIAQAAYLDRVVAWWRQGNGAGEELYSGLQLKLIHKRHGENDNETHAALGMSNLRKRATHGAHVLDLFTGPMPARSRVSPSRMTDEGQDGSAHLPPTWERPVDRASQAPLVLVQPPEDAIDDPTGRWLGRHVLGGVDFILSAANRLKRQETGLSKNSMQKITGVFVKGSDSAAQEEPSSEAAASTQQHIVINISWGPQTGPHDGSSLLELALLERVQSAEKENQRLEIVLPAGNSYQARAHAQFSAKQGCDGLEWHVMPDTSHPQFLEIWWPAGVPINKARISVTAPDGSTLSNHPSTPAASADSGHGVWGQADGAWQLVVVPHPAPDSERQMALLALAPTRAGHPSTAKGSAAAPHGCWTIRVKPVIDGIDGEVHLYVARNAANMGARRRSKDSYLHDPEYERQRQNQAPHRPTQDNRPVRRKGTLNGIATMPADQGCFVIGGHVLNKTPKPGEAWPPDLAAPYASSGPGAPGGREAPDNSLPTDESPYLRGVRGGAVREGSSIRLIGTSTAAPQLARKLANGRWPPAAAAQGRTAAPPPSASSPPQSSSASATPPPPSGDQIGKGPLPMTTVPRAS